MRLASFLLLWRVACRGHFFFTFQTSASIVLPIFSNPAGEQRERDLASKVYADVIAKANGDFRCNLHFRFAWKGTLARRAARENANYLLITFYTIDPRIEIYIRTLIVFRFLEDSWLLWHVIRFHDP